MTRGDYTGLEATILYYTGQKKEKISSLCCFFFKKRKALKVYPVSSLCISWGQRKSQALYGHRNRPCSSCEPPRGAVLKVCPVWLRVLFLWEQRTKWWWASSFLLPCSQCSLNSMMPLIGLHGISEQEENRSLIFPKRKTRTIKDDLLVKKSFYTIEGKK